MHCRCWNQELLPKDWLRTGWTLHVETPYMIIIHYDFLLLYEIIIAIIIIMVIGLWDLYVEVY